MLRRCFLLRSGHGDLFPTSKAAAHLEIPWVMSREVPHAPGKNHCYADFTTPEHHSKFQLLTPEAHETKIIPTRNASKHDLHHCVTKRPSEAAINATLAGVSGDLSHHKKTNETPMARANIAAKKAAEHLAMTRDFMAHKRNPVEITGKYARVTEYPASQFYIEERVNRMRKMENTNQNGYVREDIPWHPKPTPPPPAPPKK